MTSCRSKHLKKISRDSQHFSRLVLSGAIGAPSEDILGADKELPKISENPIIGIDPVL